MRPETYPLVRCTDHRLAPAYIVCIHVVAGAPIAHRVEPADEVGEALCADCHARDFDDAPEALDLLKLVCAPCLRRLRAEHS